MTTKITRPRAEKFEKNHPKSVIQAKMPKCDGFLEFLGTVYIFFINYVFNVFMVILNTINLYFLTIFLTPPFCLVILAVNELGVPDHF